MLVSERVPPGMFPWVAEVPRTGWQGGRIKVLKPSRKGCEIFQTHISEKFRKFFRPLAAHLLQTDPCTSQVRARMQDKRKAQNDVTMITARNETIREIRVFPYYRGVPLEVDAVGKASSGKYEAGFFAGQSYYTLDLDDWTEIREVHVGATYTCTAISKDGRPLKTHWMFCTSVAGRPTFSISRHWTDPNNFAPVLPLCDTSLVHLEQLTDMVATLPRAVGDDSLLQAQIGTSGWLVMTRIGCPHMIGILIDDAVLPSHMCQGASDLVITARSVRTTQSITLEKLSCVSTKDTSLFLRLQD